MYKACLEIIIPKIREFVKKYINWSYMCRPDYDDRKVIKLFEKEVVTPLVIELKCFRPVKNFKG